MMDLWQIAVSGASLFVPVILAAIARDRSMMAMITGTRSDWQDSIAAAEKALRDAIDRVRSEYARRDDLAGHLQRMDKQFDRMDKQFDFTNQRLDEITKLLQGRT